MFPTICFETFTRSLMKVANKGFFRRKNPQSLTFLRFFSKAKTEECDQSNLSVSYKLGIAILCLATYVLEVSTNILFKVATKGSFSGKKILKTYYF